MPYGTPDLVWRLWYPWLTRLTHRTPLDFLNYGYAADDDEGDGRQRSSPHRLTLAAVDEPDRPGIQLYDAVVRPVPLHGLRVLEVSCGHGGGASYLARYCGPASVLGVDRNARAIDLCRRRHRAAGLSFARGNAMALEAEGGSFDAVVNVEASHCYPDVPRFLREVVRVLRPGGHLLFADFRSRDGDGGIARLTSQLEASGLELVEREDISAGVVRGMRLNTPKHAALVERLVPAVLRRRAARFAGVTGSPIYEELRSGETVYMRYVLWKPQG